MFKTVLQRDQYVVHMSPDGLNVESLNLHREDNNVNTNDNNIDTYVKANHTDIENQNTGDEIVKIQSIPNQNIEDHITNTTEQYQIIEDSEKDIVIDEYIMQRLIYDSINANNTKYLSTQKKTMQNKSKKKGSNQALCIGTGIIFFLILIIGVTAALTECKNKLEC
ncbi:hypothetical protein AB837_00475 [bacterium AB1]|nr:hypothetical protein AB837_00475 [bacterium AB1]